MEWTLMNGMAWHGIAQDSMARRGVGVGVGVGSLSVGGTACVHPMCNGVVQADVGTFNPDGPYFFAGMQKCETTSRSSASSQSWGSPIPDNRPGGRAWETPSDWEASCPSVAMQHPVHRPRPCPGCSVPPGWGDCR